MSTVAGSMSGTRESRWLLLGSLALNLFFVGIAVALAVRPWLAPPPGIDVSRTAAERIDRLAGTLPPVDAEKLRAAFRAHEPTIEQAHAAYRRSQEAIRAALRAEPFDVVAVRTAMSESRAARQALDVALHDVIANAAAQMTTAGRNRLADWPPAPRAGNPASR